MICNCGWVLSFGIFMHNFHVINNKCLSLGTLVPNSMD